MTSSGSQLGLLSGAPATLSVAQSYFATLGMGSAACARLRSWRVPSPRWSIFSQLEQLLGHGVRLGSEALQGVARFNSQGFSSLPVKARQERVAPKSYAGTGAGASQMSLLAKASHGSGLCRQESWVGLGVCRMSICHQTPTLHKLLS